MTRLLALALILVCLPLGVAFAEAGTSQTLIEEMVVDYGAYGGKAEAQIDGLLAELEVLDPTAAAKWSRIMDLWRSAQTALEVHPDVLPDGLDDTDALCLVVLGFQLNPDGSMRDELIELSGDVETAFEIYYDTHDIHELPALSTD